MGIVGGSRHYEEVGGPAPQAWSCPACGAEHVSVFEYGCPACGAGKPGTKAPPTLAPLPTTPQPLRLPTTPLAEAALRWMAAHPAGTMIDAFAAGYYAAQAETMRAAAPVTADLATLAPAAKEQRTIVAALRLFRDQILRDAADEIATGEFCSLDETQTLITRIEESLL